MGDNLGVGNNTTAGQDLGEQQHGGTSAPFQAIAAMYKSVVAKTTNFPREITLNEWKPNFS